MIISSFEGRIGNNLFQLAATLSLAEKLNTIATAFRTANLINIQKNFLLEDIKFIIVEDVHGFWIRSNIPVNNIYRETTHPYYDANFFNIKDDSFIDGFFQSEKYFLDIKHKIKKNFMFKNHIVEAVNNIDYFKNIENSAFIHIRRTDYLQDNNIHAYAQINDDYYINCIEESSPEVIFVFSDDIEWCENNFKKYNKNFIFVKEKDPYCNLYMMTKIKTAIIANSTFSWWGAWLGDNLNVYYPKQWYGNFILNKYKTNNENLIKDLICENWKGR